MRQLPLRLALTLCPLLGVAAGCATTAPRGVVIDRTRLEVTAPPLVTSAPAPGLDALLSTMYGPGTVTSLPLLKTQAAAALAQHPDAWEAHEAVALIAALELDHETEWTHLMRAAADLRAPDTMLHLHRLNVLLRHAGQIAAERDLFDELARQHKDPTVRHHAKRLAALRARDLGEPNAERRLDGEGVITRWRLIGPFDNDHGKGAITPYPPEVDPDHQGPVQGRVVEVDWRDVPGHAVSGNIPLDEYVQPSRHAVAYLKTYVYADKARLAQLRLSVTRETKVWVNRTLVADDSDVRRYGPDNLIAAVQLAPGYNELLIKTSQETGHWDLRARLTDDEGRPLPLPVLTQERPAKATGPALKVRPHPAAGRGHGLRDAYMSALWLWFAGRAKTALVAAQAYLDKAPENPFGEALLARLYSLNDEDGKAIDLAQAVLARPGPQVPYFLSRRHWFFRGKQRYDRAQADLDAIRVATGRDLIAVDRIQAMLFEARGWHEDRCRVLDKLALGHPGHAWLERERAECLIKLQKRKDRRTALETAHALLPGHRGHALRLLRVYVDDVDFEGARELSRQVETLYAHRPGTLLELAGLHRRMDDTGRAVRLLQLADAMAPGDPRPQAQLATIAYVRRDDPVAVQHWQEAYRRDPTRTSLLDRIDHVTQAGPNRLRQLAPDEGAIAGLVKTAQTLDVPPGTDVAYVLDDEVTRVEPDGSARAIVTLVRKAITERGRDQLIKTGYPRTHSKLVHAFVVAPDGTRQEASSIRGGTIRFRRVERGSVSVLQYEVTRPPAGFLPNHFVSSWYFQGVHRHSHRARWVLMLDDAVALHTRIDGPVEHKKTEQDGLQVHTFIGNDIGPIVPEPGMPPPSDVAARVSVSTVTGWDEYVRWERALLQDAFRSNPELEALARSLTAGQATARQKFDRLFRYVAEEIRYQQDYESTIAGVRPHACPVVLERGYGDCKDKAVLLILLGRHVGLDIDFAILRTTTAGKVVREIPNQQFNHAIVYVPAQGDIEQGFFMDPTVDGVDLGSLRQDDQGATSLVLDPDSGTHRFYDIPYQPADLEQQRFDIAVDLTTPSAARATIDVTTRGNVGSYIRRNLRDAKTAEKLFEGLGGGMFPGSRVTAGRAPDDAENIDKPVTFTIESDVRASLAVDKRGQARFRLPAHLFPLGKFALTDTRHYNIITGIPRTFHQQVTVKFGPGAVIERVPEDFKVQHHCFDAVRTTTQQQGTVSVDYQLRITCGEIAAADYPAFRTAAQKVLEQQREVIVFTAGKALNL